MKIHLSKPAIGISQDVFVSTIPEGGTHRIIDMMVFDGRLIVAADNGVYILQGDTLVPVQFVDAEPEPEKPHFAPADCTHVLRAQGKVYPRTCAHCGFGPCLSFYNDGTPRR